MCSLLRSHTANPSYREPAEVVRIARGTYGYRAGLSGTVVVTGAVSMYSAAAGAVDATIVVNSGDTITIPAGESFTATPEGTLVDPTIVFTDTAAYYISYFT